MQKLERCAPTAEIRKISIAAVGKQRWLELEYLSRKMVPRKAGELSGED